MRLEKERLLTEKEREELEAQIAADPAWEPPAGSTSSGYTTFAPEGASLEEVRAGMEPQRPSSSAGSAEYAPGGSLAKEIKKEEEAKRFTGQPGSSAQK